MEAETGGHWPGTPGASEAGEDRKDPPLEPLEGVRPRDTLISGHPPDGEATGCFKPWDNDTPG